MRDPYSAIFSYYNYWLEARLQKAGKGRAEAHTFQQDLANFRPSQFEAFAIHKAGQWRDQWGGCLRRFDLFGKPSPGMASAATCEARLRDGRSPSPTSTQTTRR